MKTKPFLQTWHAIARDAIAMSQRKRARSSAADGKIRQKAAPSQQKNLLETISTLQNEPFEIRWSNKHQDLILYGQYCRRKSSSTDQGQITRVDQNEINQIDQHCNNFTDQNQINQNHIDQVQIDHRKVDHRLPSGKIAAFDLDGTIIKTKSGKVHAQDASDWTWWHPNIPEKIQSIGQQGYTIAIFSNQGRAKFGSKTYSLIRTKIYAICKKLGTEVFFLAAVNNDLFRKPRIGMWDLLREQLHPISPDLKESFYVGDAAGRESDFSCVDRKFAANIGIQFYTPEEYFLGETPSKFSWGSFEPLMISPPSELESEDNLLNYFESLKSQPSDKPIVCVLCGIPGSGKSTIYTHFLEPLNFERINQDTLKTLQRCVKTAKDFLFEKSSIAIDNTNLDATTRKIWIDLAREFGAQIDCLLLDVDIEHALHNNTYRALGSGSFADMKKRELIPERVIQFMASKLERPNISEGFDRVIEVKPGFRGTKKDHFQWTKWWR